MSSDELYKFSAYAAGVMADFAHITLYDGFLNTLVKGYGRIERELSKGLYKLVMVLGEQMTEQMVRVDKDTVVMIPVAESPSSVLAAGLGNTHEYYSDNAKIYYSKQTTSAGNPGAQESIFIFFRYPDSDTFHKCNPLKQSLGENFKLLDRNRKTICALASSNVIENLNDGWLVLHINLSPGNYYLYYGGRKAEKGSDVSSNLPAREIPIRVFSGWQTQCFMTFGEGPMFRSFYVALCEVKDLKTYQPERNDIYNIEGLLQKFRNGIYYVPDNIIVLLTEKKWKNPILGLLAAYCYFHSSQKNKDELFREVVINLADLLGAETPDYIALRIAAATYFGDPILPELVITEPCMILTGFRAIIKIVGSHIVPGSLAEEAVGMILPDLFWTSYKPLSGIWPGKRQDPTSIHYGVKINTPTNVLNIEPGQGETAQAPTSMIRKPKILSSWVANSLMDTLSRSDATGIDMAELAEHLRLTRNILNQTAADILAKEPEIKVYLKGKEKIRDLEVFNQVNMERLKNTYKTSALN